jgi:hypothetical protein
VFPSSSIMLTEGGVGNYGDDGLNFHILGYKPATGLPDNCYLHLFSFFVYPKIVPYSLLKMEELNKKVHHKKDLGRSLMKKIHPVSMKLRLYS